MRLQNFASNRVDFCIGRRIVFDSENDWLTDTDRHIKISYDIIFHLHIRQRGTTIPSSRTSSPCDHRTPHGHPLKYAVCLPPKIPIKLSRFFSDSPKIFGHAWRAGLLKLGVLLKRRALVINTHFTHQHCSVYFQVYPKMRRSSRASSPTGIGMEISSLKRWPEVPRWLKKSTVTKKRTQAVLHKWEKRLRVHRSVS